MMKLLKLEKCMQKEYIGKTPIKNISINYLMSGLFGMFIMVIDIN